MVETTPHTMLTSNTGSIPVAFQNQINQTMEKQVIETLISDCTKQRDISKHNYKLYSQKVENENCRNVYAQFIDTTKAEMELYEKCLDQLNKLKEFDLSEENIEDMVPGGNMDNEQVYTQYMKGYRGGLYKMYEHYTKLL